MVSDLTLCVEAEVERNITTMGIVLSSQRSGGLNRKLRILTVDYGIVEVVSYGAQKSQKAVKAELCTDGNFFLYFNPVKKTYALSDVQVLSLHESLRQDLALNYASLFFCEMVLKTNGGDYGLVYSLLSKALDLLEDSTKERNQVLIQFIWKLIDICGLKSDLSCCPLCDHPYEKDEILGFSFPLTAPCCINCATVKDDFLLTPGARRYLALTSTMDYQTAVDVPLSPIAQRRIKLYLLRYASIICGGSLKTLEGSILQVQL